MKHLLKEAIRKIKYKQMMWKTYRHTESEGDYTIYKEAFNQATAEIRNSERCYEQKIAFNKKNLIPRVFMRTFEVNRKSRIRSVL